MDWVTFLEMWCSIACVVMWTLRESHAARIVGFRAVWLLWDGPFPRMVHENRVGPATCKASRLRSERAGGPFRETKQQH